MGEDGVATTVFLGKGVKISQQQTASNAEERVKLYAQEMASMPNSGMRFTDEYEINDYTQEARWKVTNKEALAEMTELTGLYPLIYPAFPFAQVSPHAPLLGRITTHLLRL